MANEIIHENEVEAKLATWPESEAWKLLLETTHTLTCEDYGMIERLEATKKIRDAIEARLGPVHWMGMACCEGECDFCIEKGAIEGGDSVLEKVDPYVSCRYCNGTGKNPVTGRSRYKCGDCKGAGRLLRGVAKAKAKQYAGGLKSNA